MNTQLFVKLITLIIICIFISCEINNSQKKHKKDIYIFSGVNEQYFELITRFKNDSVYAQIVDLRIGSMPGFKNSVDKFNKTGSISEDDFYKLIDFDGDIHLSHNNKLMPLKLVDTLMLADRDYLNSTGYDADFSYRSSDQDTNAVIKVEEFYHGNR